MPYERRRGRWLISTLCAKSPVCQPRGWQLQDAHIGISIRRLKPPAAAPRTPRRRPPGAELGDQPGPPPSFCFSLLVHGPHTALPGFHYRPSWDVPSWLRPTPGPRRFFPLSAIRRCRRSPNRRPHRPSAAFVAALAHAFIHLPSPVPRFPRPLPDSISSGLFCLRAPRDYALFSYQGLSLSSLVTLLCRRPALSAQSPCLPTRSPTTTRRRLS